MTTIGGILRVVAFILASALLLYTIKRAALVKEIGRMRTMFWGIVFVFASGLLYTIERAAAWIARGAMGAGGHGDPGESLMPSIVDNGFAICFLVVGILLVIEGLIGRAAEGRNPVLGSADRGEPR